MAATDTPRGNAAVLQPWAAYINAAIANARQQYGVTIPAWLVGAIIMHESGGIPGNINTKSGASGLMQVATVHSQYDFTRLRGTAPGDIAYQINAGVEVLAQHIRGAGGDVAAGVQNYGGGSTYPGSYYNELVRGYKTPVEDALNPFLGDAGATSGQIGGVNAGGFQQSLVGIVQFFQNLMQPDTWTRAALIAGGVLVALIGAGLVVNESRAGQAARKQATTLAMAAA